MAKGGDRHLAVSNYFVARSGLDSDHKVNPLNIGPDGKGAVDQSAPTGSSTVDVLALVLRPVLVLSTAFLAGGGLLRPLVGELPRRQVSLSVLGGVSVLFALVSEFVVDINIVVLAVAVPILPHWPPTPPVSSWATSRTPAA